MGGMLTGLDNTVMGALTDIVSVQAAQYSGMMSVLVVSSVTVFLIYRGYQTIGGKLQSPIAEVVWDIGRMLIILAFVVNVSNYMSFVVGSINDFKNGFSGDGSDGNIWTVLDNLWASTQTLGQTLYDQDDSTYVKFNGGVAETLVWAGTLLILCISIIVNMGAEIMILLMEATGPIFIFCLMYGFLREMFNNWLKVIFTAILTLLFSSFVLQVMIRYLTKVISASTAGATESNLMTIGVMCLLAGFASAFVVWLSAKIAGALAGASVLGAMQGAAAVGMLSAGFMAKQSISPATKAGQGALKGTGKALDYVGGKAANAISGHMNTQAMKKASVNNMRKLNK